MSKLRDLEEQNEKLKDELKDNKKAACKFCKKKDKPLCEHGFCPKCGCKQYCWID